MDRPIFLIFETFNPLEVVECAEKLPTQAKLETLLFSRKLLHDLANRTLLGEDYMARISCGLLRSFFLTHKTLEIAALMPPRLSEVLYLST